LVGFLDFIVALHNKQHQKNLEELKNQYQTLQELKTKLKQILTQEQQIEDLVSYTKFEIDKIAKIDPKPNEYDELKDIKDQISKKEKFEAKLEEITPILSQLYKISDLLNQFGISGDFFDDAVAQVEQQLTSLHTELKNIDIDDIEQVLTRIEQLSGLIKRFGSLQEAIEYRNKKEQELQKYENIYFEKSILQKNIKKTQQKLDELANLVSQNRKQYLYLMEDEIKKYLKYLYLDNLTITIKPKQLDSTGIDVISFFLHQTPLESLSSGEFNRLRLALLVARGSYELDQQGGILFLDEIDANLSGKESQSIAKILIKLSKQYQIFCISHQPQLSSVATQHFVVEKNQGISSARLLNKQERIEEIARMISAEDITQEAKNFAKQLINNFST
jgi:DNA repair protein RecN (Recombination protein N)